MRRITKQLLLAGMAAGIVVFITSCMTGAAGGGASRPAPVHKNWWNYYERGVLAAGDGQWTDARHDFEVCLGVRPGAKYGYPREKWQARTYGVRFLNDYFPHRELGVALFKLGETRAAVAELEESLRQEPSGRAKHYLNEAMRAVQQGQRLTGPLITLDRVGGTNAYCRTPSVAISGRVTAEGRVGRIEVGGDPEYIELAEPVRSFSKAVRLKPGTNDIPVLAADLNGRTTKVSVRRIADWTTPALGIRTLTEQAGVMTVGGSVSDDYELTNVEVKNSRQPLKQTRQGPGAIFFEFAFPSEEKPVLEALDAAGNRLRVDVQSLVSRMPHAVAIRNSDGGIPVGIFRAAPPLSLMNGMLSHPPLMLPSRLALAAKPQDMVKPTLRLLPEQQLTHVHVTAFYVEGEAGDPGGVASVTVNGQEYVRPCDKGAKTVSFGGLLPLDRGTNQFDVVAEDMAGNHNGRTFTVVCSEPEHREAAYRLAVGIPPFCPQGDAWAWQARARLQKEFTRLPVRFRLLERDEGWDYILRELGLSVSELADPRTALRVGKMLSAELLFVGAVLKQGDGVTVQVRTVDSTEGSIVFTTDVYAENPEKDLPYQLGGLFIKITQGFPAAEGHIVDIKGDKVSLDVGSSQGIRVGTKFIVVRAEGADALLGDEEVLTLSDRSVSVEVDRVQAEASRGRIAPPEAARLLQKGDRIYAR